MEKKPLTGHIRKQLLLELELTLQKALVMAGQIESAMAEAKALTFGVPTSFREFESFPYFHSLPTWSISRMHFLQNQNYTW